MATVKTLNYLNEIAGMSWRHSGQLAFTLASASLAAATIAVASSLHLFAVLLPAVALALVFEAAVAAWRLHRRQEISIATTRSLLDLNAADLADLQRSLLARYRNRERRMQKHHAANVTRLTADIQRLRAGQTYEQNRADDDGWPVTKRGHAVRHSALRWKAAVQRSRTLRSDRKRANLK